MRRKITEWLEWVADQPLDFSRRLAQAATFLTLFAGIYLIVRDHQSKKSSSLSAGDPAAYQDLGSAKGVESLEYYLGPIQKRPLFKIIKSEPQKFVAAKPAVRTPPLVPVKTLADLSADLSLVGVLQSGEPQAIILNRKSQKTHYVSVGQTLGEVRVVRIQQDRVTIGYNEETLDLSM